MKPTVRGRIESLVIHLATISEQIGKFKAKNEMAGKSDIGLVEDLEKMRNDMYRQLKAELIISIHE